MNNNLIFRLFVLFSVNHVFKADFELDTKDLTTDEFQLECLVIHNKFREKHCANQLKYSPKLKIFATRRATALAKTNGNNFGRLINTVFGENIFRYDYYNKSAKVECKPIVENWYRERVTYDWKKGDAGEYSRQFAQTIWNSTQRIGCASVATDVNDSTTDIYGQSFRNQVFVVCNYYNLDKFLPQNSSANVFSVEKCEQILSKRKMKTIILTNGQWLQECIKVHNKLRKDHSVDPLVIDDETFQASQKRATEMAQRGYRFFRHERSEFGENIHWSKLTNGSHPLSCNISISKWYREKSNYDWDFREKPNGTVRHFLQIIWKSTTTLGCAQVQNIEEPKGGVYTVCLYKPKAKYQNNDLEWENIFPILDKTITTTTTTEAPIPITAKAHDYEHIDELDDETELEKEFKDVDDMIDTRAEYQRQTPAPSLEDMLLKTTTAISSGFDRNEYIHKRKGGKGRKT